MAVIKYSGQELLDNPSVLTEFVNSVSDTLDDLQLDVGGVIGNGGDVTIDTARGTAEDEQGTVLFYLYRYIHLRVSSVPSGAGFSDDPSTITGSTIYIGLANSASLAAPSVASGYTWTEFNWPVDANVQYNIAGGGRFNVKTAVGEPDDFFVIYDADTGVIDLFETAAGANGADAVDVQVFSYVPQTNENVTFDPATWTPTTQNFKNDEMITKALAARLFIGGIEVSSYANYSFRWLKNSQTTYVPQAPQKAYSGSGKQVLLINNDDVTDNGQDLFICEVSDT